MTDLAAKLEPLARGLLVPGETLTGCCVATWQKTFSGRMVAIAIAPARIVVQPVDRRFAAAGPAIPLPPERLARVRLLNGVGASVTVPSILMEMVSITADLTTTDGERLKLMMMGSGGQVQHDGLEALLAFLDPLT